MKPWLDGFGCSSRLLPPLVCTLQEFVAAAEQLGPSEDPAQLKTASDSLAAMLPLTDSLTALVDLRAAVTVVQAAGTTDAYVPTALADLQAVKEVADAVAAIAGTLHTLQVSGQRQEHAAGTCWSWHATAGTAGTATTYCDG